MAHARNGCSQSLRFLPQARKIVGSGDENGSFSKSTALAELRFADIDAATTSILREHDSESEELEQFVFQPKSRREGKATFHQLNSVILTRQRDCDFIVKLIGFVKASRLENFLCPAKHFDL